MEAIVVAGVANAETTLRVDGFPLVYAPVRYPTFGIRTTPGGVGLNVAAALAALGRPVRLAALIGQDPAGALVTAGLAARGLPRDWVLETADATSQSVVLVDPDGRRQVHTDLKDMQECTYPVERFAEALEGCALAVITTINYTRPLLACAARAGVPVATDVQAIAEIDDAYNADYLRAACIVFMSGERLPVGPEEWAREILGRYGPEILVIGLGAAGALLAVRRDGRLERVPAVRTRPIVSTVGAGDALFAAFVHGYTATRDPYGALRKAIVFASYKIGAVGGAEGFLSAEQLDALATQVRLGS